MKSKKKKINYNKLIRLGVVFITILIISFIFPKSESIEREVKVGDIWTSKDLIAQFSFPVLKYPEEYERDLIEAEKSVLPIFEYNDTIQSFCYSSLKIFTENLKRDFKLLATNPLISDSILNLYSIEIDTIKLQKILKQITPEYFNSFELITKNLIEYIYSIGYINIPKQEIQKDSIFVRRKNEEKKFEKNNFLDQKDVEQIILQSLEQFNDLRELSIPLLRNFANEYIKPNIIFNDEETQLAIEQARYKVSKNVGIVLENERIVAKHQKITEDIKRKIDSYRRIKFEKGEKFDFILQYIGKFLHITVIILLLGIYIYLFRKKIYNDTSKILILSIIFILISFFAFVTSRIETDLPLEYLILIPTSSMLVTIIFDSRLGFYVTVVISLIIGGIRGNDYTITTANIVAGALAVYSVRDIKNRAQIFRSLVFIFCGYFAAIIAFGFERYSPIIEMGNETIFALINSIISPILTYGLLIFFERIFKVTTDLTLIELADFNHPLLQELKSKAPGTFHHSVNISVLSESAAKAIGANTILTKVGALYHDIGKIVEPNYFIENLRDEKSEHEDLNPEQSAQIILNHVEEGIELARKYNLPEEVIDFIPMHHGTTHVQYFLKIAKQLGKKIDEDKFRYPGPKPQSKETGIVMLADAVESMSRNLEVVNENILNQLIDEIIRKRFLEGQLDESNLTLRDLNLIKQSFVETLLGVYHQRIKYPEN
ncbi:MAG: HDIG domain-containing protein [Ignavibacteria bacterium]|jgi:putative nucleotidyltransferase with HDIG domain|nr:HDIG domain-containing protein [Ignavibacteria bacterium]MDH7526947.1 HDIG domain-containing protein [Ignavibacteria bacterium]